MQIRKAKKEEKSPVYIKLGLLVVFVVIAVEIGTAWNMVNVNYLKQAETEKLNAAAAEALTPAKISVIELNDSSCINCFDVKLLADSIQSQQFVNVTSLTTLQYDSDQAKALIKKYNITVIPSVIVQGEFTKSNVEMLWEAYSGVVFQDGVYIPGLPPYRNLQTGEIIGLVKIILLSDKSCSICYDVNLHKLILPRFGVKTVSEDTYDISSPQGKDLIAKYNITKAPTLLISPEAKVYDTLTQVWTEVGTVESDGWYVFRATEQMGNYTDLLTNQVVNATT